MFAGFYCLYLAMVFSDYKSIAQVQTEDQTKYEERNFIKAIDSYTVSDLPHLLGITKSIFDQAVNSLITT